MPDTQINPFHVWCTEYAPDESVSTVLISLWSDLMWYGYTQEGATTHYLRITGFLLALRAMGYINQSEHLSMLDYARGWMVSKGLAVPAVPPRRDGLED